MKIARIDTGMNIHPFPKISGHPVNVRLLAVFKLILFSQLLQ